ncbi:hypothetical protein ABPG72_020283 [Tetrahymena utriculariae]
MVKQKLSFWLILVALIFSLAGLILSIVVYQKINIENENSKPQVNSQPNLSYDQQQANTNKTIIDLYQTQNYITQQLKDQMQTQKTIIDDIIKQFNTNFTQLQANINKTIFDLNQTQNKITQRLQAQLETQNTVIDNIIKQFNTNFTQHQAHIDETILDLNQTQNKITKRLQVQLETQNTVIDGTIKQFNTNFTQHQAHIDETILDLNQTQNNTTLQLQVQLQTQNTIIFQLTQKVNKLQEQINLTNFTQQIQYLHQNLTIEGEQLDNLNNQIKQLQNQTNSIQSSIDGLTPQIKNITDLNQTISKLQSDVKNLTQQQNNFIDIPEKINTLQQNQTAQNTQQNNLNSSIQFQQNYTSQLQGQVNSLASQIQNTTTDVNQKISQLQSNISNLNSSLIQVNQSIPVTTIYQITPTKNWYYQFIAPLSEGIIYPELYQILEIKTQSLVTMNLQATYFNRGNEIFISFAINGASIGFKQFSESKQKTFYYGSYYTEVSDTYIPFTLQQKKILGPGIYIIQLIAQTFLSNGQQITIGGPSFDIQVQTLPQKNY